VTADKVQIIKGLVLLIAVGIDVYSKRRGGPSLIGRMFPGKRQESEALSAEQPAVLPATDSAEDSSRSLTS
jgi:putative multiple sugar transport system permease protein